MLETIAAAAMLAAASPPSVTPPIDLSTPVMSVVDVEDALPTSMLERPFTSPLPAVPRHDPWAEQQLLREVAAERELPPELDDEPALAVRADAQGAQDPQERGDEPTEVPTTPAEPEPEPATSESEAQPQNVWDRLAECEANGEWDYGPHSGWGSGIHHGGLQFHPQTWDEFRGPEHPSVAYNATREQQIAVAERVLEVQGWGAWPACSRSLGLR